MAAPISSIESHPQRQFIVDSLLAGTTLRDIAAKLSPAVSIAAISRFKLNALAKTQSAFTALTAASSTNANNGATQSTEVATAVTRTALALAVDPFVQRCLQHQATIDAALVVAQKGEGRDTIASLVSTDYRGLELHAKLAGRLDSAANQTTNNLHVYLSVPRGDPARVIDGKVEPED